MALDTLTPVLVFLTAVLTLLGLIVRGIYKAAAEANAAFSTLATLVSATRENSVMTRENTGAIRELTRGQEDQQRRLRRVEQQLDRERNRR